MNWKYVHRLWALCRCPRKLSTGAQTLCILLMLCLASPVARADCPAAPIANPDDMAISFLTANGVQAASASLLASSIKEGTLIYDDTANKLKVCDGDNWIEVGSGSGTDTLASLSCASGEIPKYNGTAWACAADGGGSGTESVFAVSGTATLTGTTIRGFSSVGTNIGSAYNNSTGVFTAPEAGRYFFSGSVLPMTGTSATLQLFKSGTGVVRSYMDNADANNIPVSAAMDLAPGDTVSMNLTTGTLHANAWHSFTGFKLGGGAAGGGGGSSTMVAFEANRTGGANQTVTTNTWTKLVLATEVYDVGNAYDPATSRFMPQVAGKYVVSAGAYCLGVATACSVMIYKNGAGHSMMKPSSVASNDLIPRLTTIVDMNGSTDYIEAYAYTGGTTIGGSTMYTSFGAALLGGSSSSSDTLAGLSCATNEIPKWNGSAWACASDGGGSGGGGLEYFAGSGLLVGGITYHNVTPTNHYPVTVPPGTKAVKLTVNYHHQSATPNTHGYLSFSAYQKGQTNASKKVSYSSYHYNDYANSDIAYLDIPWDDSLDDEVTIQVTSSLNTDTLNNYAIYLAGYVVGDGGGGGSSQWTTIGNDLHYGTGGVAIGQTVAPDASATLELESTTKGFLPPRMTTVQRDAISSPAVGLMIFDTTAAQYQFWNGTAWSGLGSGGVPTGTIAAFALATCPSGWTEYTAARGRFLRGIDPTGASVDPDGTRAPGNLQADAMQQITGSMGFNRTAASNLVGAFVGGGTPGASGATSGSNAAGSVAFNSANSPSARTSVETRPKNVAVLFCQYNGSGGGGGGSSQWTDVTGGINYAGGKVGIGTTAPAGPLHVVTTAAVPAITMERTGDANVFLEFESTTGLTGVDGGGSSGFLRFYTAGAQRMIVNSAGNIGIGTTTPQSLLQVAGGIQLADDAAACPGASNVKLGTLKYGSNVLSVCNTGGWTTLTAGGGTLSGGTSGYLGVWTGATTMGLSSTVAGQSLFWDATNHRLGIGTTNPQDALDLGLGTSGRSIVWGGSTGTNHYASVGTTYSFGSLSLVRGLKLATGGADQYLYSYATGSRAGIRIGGGSASDISFFNEPAATQTVGDAFDYVANTKMTIKDSGNVGVGTTAPSSLLHVKKDQTAATTQILVENVGAADPATISALSVGEGGVAYGSLRRYRDGSGTVELANVQNAPLHLLTNNIRRLTILGTGNVGIGTTSPTAAGGIAGYDTPLYIANAGNPLLVVQSTANGAANLAGVALKTGISTNYWQMYAKNGKFTVGVASVGDFLTIDGTGNVGIGTTSPAQKLDVSGIVQVRTTSNGFLQLNPGSTTQNGYVGFFGAGGTRSGYVGWGNQGNVHLTADTGMVVLQAGASGWTATLDNAGSFSVPAAAYKPGGGAWAASSDARLKDIDGDYDQGLDSIIRLNPIRFHYKKDNARKEPSGKSFVGLIAQEVQKAFPEAVSEGRDGYLSLDTTPINFAVINAIKELKADNDNLRAELQAANENYKDQDAALENLRREIDALKAAR